MDNTPEEQKEAEISLYCPCCKTLLPADEERLRITTIPILQVCNKCGTCFIPIEIQAEIKKQAEQQVKIFSA